MVAATVRAGGETQYYDRLRAGESPKLWALALHNKAMMCLLIYGQVFVEIETADAPLAVWEAKIGADGTIYHTRESS